MKYTNKVLLSYLVLIVKMSLNDFFVFAYGITINLAWHDHVFIIIFHLETGCVLTYISAITLLLSYRLPSVTDLVK